MQDRVVLITGAKGGLGNFVSERFLAAGAQVVGVSRSIKDSDFPNPRFTATSADLSDDHAVRSLVAGIVQRFGRLDTVAHIAGGFRGGKSLTETDDDTFEAMFSLNVKAFFNIARAAVPNMKNGGRIVAVASRNALEPSPNAAAYAASKAALVSLVRSLAGETKGRGITVNAVLPGTMDTSANRMAIPNADTSKWVPPAKVAEVVYWLASDAAEHVSGAAIPVFGRDV
jgi:NAD(P)-dependent dehydrogenase (short-subunit alcohol dehydrogenase family)